MGTARLKSCCIIGAGNVASHLAKAVSMHMQVLQIFSRNIHHARELADKIAGARPIGNLADLTDDADLYLICVSDDAIPQVISLTPDKRSGIWVHTSGSTPISVFEGKKSRFGVLYPLQTFSKSKEIDLRKVTVFTEGSDSQTLAEINGLACKLSDDVRPADSDARGRLHAAAVFACNFVNLLMAEAEAIAVGAGADFSTLRPLIRETIDKLNTLSPAEAQTGPARRGDIKTVNRHLKLLDNDQSAIYRILSDRIYKKYNEQD